MLTLQKCGLVNLKMNKLLSHIQQIESLFMEIEEFVSNTKSIEKIHSHLEAVPLDFKSIAYESASMAIAYEDLKNRNSLETWEQFCSTTKSNHTFHIQIGLGWAFGKAEIWPEIFNPSYYKNELNLLYDGLGYFYALYKGRRTIKQALAPVNINPIYLSSFDHGVGRRLWYISKGDIELLHNYLSLFSKNRHKNIWQGIGIAAGYVGGIDSPTFEKLKLLFGEFEVHFKEGVQLAILSRHKSETLTNDTDLICKLFF
jgi:hypothetical protein